MLVPEPRGRNRARRARCHDHAGQRGRVLEQYDRREGLSCIYPYLDPIPEVGLVEGLAFELVHGGAVQHFAGGRES